MTTPDATQAPAWGLLPESLRQRLYKLEWQNRRHLRQRLNGQRPFPITLTLKSPTGKQALADLAHYQRYQQAWQPWRESGCERGQLHLQTRQLTQLGAQHLPSQLQLHSLDELIEFLGPDIQQQWQAWQAAMAPLLSTDASQVATMRQLLLHELPLLETLTPALSTQLCSVLRQLKTGMGAGGYLRALPVTGVDTKFVEQQLNTLATLSAAISWINCQPNTTALCQWLDCQAAPNDWLLVRILDRHLAQQHFHGQQSLRLPASQLQAQALPGKRLLIVENLQSGYALPPLPNTIAICGAGNHLTWASAHWLADKQLGYWGDIDTWGLHMLARVRQHQPHVQALLMDLETLLAHQQAMALNSAPNPSLPTHLKSAEITLYQDLLTERLGGRGLEQERIAQDHILQTLRGWCSGLGTCQPINPAK